jgi:hypothetical protein
MFNFFKKKEVMGYNETVPDEFNMDVAYNKLQTEQWQKEHKESIQTDDLYQIIMEIHNSYDSSVDKLLAEAKEILANCQTEDIKKGERLSKLGFTNSIKAKQSEEVLRKKAEAENQAKLIDYYKFNYPNQKFITREQVSKINKKYGLVCVTADCYKMDIPEKNLREIEAFSLKEGDEVYCVSINSWKYSHALNFQVKGEYTIIDKDADIHVSEEPFYISCPPSEAIIKNGYSVREDGFILKDEIKDPIVMKPVNGGFLIVSKWGLEASDEIVVNERMN